MALTEVFSYDISGALSSIREVRRAQESLVEDAIELTIDAKVDDSGVESILSGLSEDRVAQIKAEAEGVATVDGALDEVADEERESIITAILDDTGINDAISKLATPGGAIALAGGAAALAFGSAFSQASDISAFENKVRTSLQVTATVADQLGNEAGDLYQSGLVDSIEEAGPLIEDVFRRFADDIPTEELSGFAEQIVAVSDALDLEPAGLSQIVDQLQDSGLADTVQGALDLASALGTTAIPAEDVATLLGEYAPILGDIGLSGEQVLSALQADFINTELEADKVLDGIKELGIRLLEITPDQIEDLADAAGISTDEIIKMVDAANAGDPAAIQGIIDTLEGIEDPARRAALAGELVGTPYEDLGDQILTIDLLGGALGDLEGAGQRASDAATGGLIPTLTRLQRSVMRPLAELVESTVVPALGALAGVIEGMSFDLIADNLQIVLPVLGALAGVIVAVVIPAFVTWATAAWAAAAAQIGAAAPAVALGVAIGLLAAGIIWAYQNIEIFRTIVDTAADILQAGFAIAVDVAMAAVGFLADVFTNVVVPAFEFLITAGQAVVDFISGDFAAVWEFIQDVVSVAVEVITTVVTAAWDAITAVTSLVWDAISLYFETWWLIVSTLFDVALDLLTTALQTAWDFITAAISLVWDGITLYFRTWWLILSTMFDVALAALRFILETTWNIIRTTAETVWNALSAAVTGIINLMVGVITGILTGLQVVAALIWNGMKSTAETVWNAIRDTVTTIVNLVRDNVTGALETLRDRASGILDRVKSIFTSAFDAIKGPIDAVISAVQGVLDIIARIPTSISLPSIPGTGAISNLIGSLNPFADGGIVAARPGGVAALIAENDGDELLINSRSSASRQLGLINEFDDGKLMGELFDFFESQFAGTQSATDGGSFGSENRSENRGDPRTSGPGVLNVTFANPPTRSDRVWGESAANRIRSLL